MKVPPPPQTCAADSCRRGRCIAALVFLLALGLIVPCHPAALANEAVSGKFAPVSDEGEEDSKTETVAPSRHVRHTAPSGILESHGFRAIRLLRVTSCASSAGSSRTVDRTPAKTPLRC